MESITLSIGKAVMKNILVEKNDDGASKKN